MKSHNSILKYLIFPIILIGCDSGIKKGSELTQADLSFIERIGLKEEKEKIILFSSQLDKQTSGNIITDKRLASYWIDKNKEKNIINSAFYTEIDTLIIEDLSDSFTYASFIKVIKNDQTEFKLYVDDNAKRTNKFFKIAIAEWEKRKE